MDEVADSNSVAPTIFSPLYFLVLRAFLAAGLPKGILIFDD